MLGWSRPWSRLSCSPSQTICPSEPWEPQDGKEYKDGTMWVRFSSSCMACSIRQLKNAFPRLLLACWLSRQQPRLCSSWDFGAEENSWSSPDLQVRSRANNPTAPRKENFFRPPIWYAISEANRLRILLC